MSTHVRSSINYLGAWNAAKFKHQALTDLVGSQIQASDTDGPMKV